MTEKIIVAIDGYPACGKSTVAKRLAENVGYTYIDSGAMYRAAALFYKRTGEEMNEMTVTNIHLDFQQVSGIQHIFLNGEDVEKDIRTLEIGELASKIGIVDCVRIYLGKVQRHMGKDGGIVMDGRDIGTTVFPNAQLKLFLTADRNVRAEHRWIELGKSIPLSDVLSDLEKRDWRDVDQFNGSRKAPDAITIDTTVMTEEEQYNAVKSLFDKYFLHPEQ